MQHIKSSTGPRFLIASTPCQLDESSTSKSAKRKYYSVWCQKLHSLKRQEVLNSTPLFSLNWIPHLFKWWGVGKDYSVLVLYTCNHYGAATSSAEWSCCDIGCVAVGSSLAVTPIKHLTVPMFLVALTPFQLDASSTDKSTKSKYDSVWWKKCNGLKTQEVLNPAPIFS